MGALHLQRAPANFDTYLIVSYVKTVGRASYYVPILSLGLALFNKLF